MPRLYKRGTFGRNSCGLGSGKAVGDLGENVADLRTENRQNRNDDDRNQDKDERVFDQTLSLFVLTGQIKLGYSAFKSFCQVFYEAA